MPETTLVDVEEAPVLADRAERTVRALFEQPLLDATWSRYEAHEPGPEPHVHHEHVDAFYVVEGELEFRVGPDLQPVRAPAGTFVLVPPGVVHTFDNMSDARARWLNLHAPSTGFVAYLRGDLPGFDSHDPPADGGLPVGNAIVAEPGTNGLLGEAPQLSARELVVEPGESIERTGDGVQALFFLEGELEVEVDRRIERCRAHTWLSVPPAVQFTAGNRGSDSARVLSFRAPS